MALEILLKEKFVRNKFLEIGYFLKIFKSKTGLYFQGKSS